MPTVNKKAGKKPAAKPARQAKAEAVLGKPTLPKLTLPKTPGACADAIYAIEQELADANRHVKALEDRRSVLRTHVEENFKKEDLTGAMGQRGVIEFVPKTKYNVEDWDKLNKFIIKEKALDLLQRRLSDKAIADRFEAKVNVPGVKPYRFQYMSVKAKK